MRVNKDSFKNYITGAANNSRRYFSSKSKANHYLQKAIHATDQPSSKLRLIRYSLLSICHAIHSSISLRYASVSKLENASAEALLRSKSDAYSEMAYALAAALVGSLVFRNNDLYKAFDGTEMTEVNLKAEVNLEYSFNMLNEVNKERYIETINAGKLSDKDELLLLKCLLAKQNVNEISLKDNIYSRLPKFINNPDVSVDYDVIRKLQPSSEYQNEPFLDEKEEQAIKELQRLEGVSKTADLHESNEEIYNYITSKGVLTKGQAKHLLNRMILDQSRF